MSEDAAEEVRSLSGLAQSFAPLAVVVIAGLYAVGLLIVNINLAQYGLVRLDLGRPEYIMTGVLWGFFVIISTLFVLPAARMPLWGRVIARSLGVIIPCYFFITINMTGIPPVPGRPSIGLGQVITSVRIGLAGLSISLVVSQVPLLIDWRRIQEFLPPIPGRPSIGLGQVITSVNPMNLLSVTLAYLVSVMFYATLAFPELPRSFGGGRPPAVELVLTEMPDLPWSDLGVSVDSNSKRKHVGPVLLLLETDQHMIFKALAGQSCCLKAFGIQNKLIQAIVYMARCGSSQIGAVL